MLDELLINDDIDENEKIYLDFDFKELAGVEVSDHYNITKAPVKLSQVWGIHSSQPEAQAIWEKSLKSTVDQLVADNVEEYLPYFRVPKIASAKGKNDDRPKLYDPISKMWILIDTGAAVSVWPKRLFQGAKLDSTLVLEAVNSSRIATYGKRIKEVRIGRKSYHKEIILADVEMPVLGWDFLKKYHLSLMWTEDDQYMELFDRKAAISARLKVEKVTDHSMLGLAPMEVAEDSEKQQVNHNEK